jgi:hypothetical protein
VEGESNKWLDRSRNREREEGMIRLKQLNVCHNETESSLVNFVSLNLKLDAGVIYCW